MKRKAPKTKTQYSHKKTSNIIKVKEILDLLNIDTNKPEYEDKNINKDNLQHKQNINLKGSLDNNNEVDDKEIRIGMNKLELNQPGYEMKNQWQINFEDVFEKYSDFSIDSNEDDKIKNINSFNLSKDNNLNNEIISKINHDEDSNYILKNITDKNIMINDKSIKNYNNRDISNVIVKEGKFLLYNGFKYKLNTLNLIIYL